MTAARPERSGPGVFHYAFLSWRRAPERGPALFSVHERSTYGSIIVGLLLLVAAELFPVHVLLSRWNPWAAWTATALSLYSALWFLADWQATRLQPIRLTRDGMTLRAGLRWSAEIPIGDIETIARPGPEPADGERPLRLAAFEDPDVIIRTRTPVQVRGPYGMAKPARALAVKVDEPERLIEAWRAAAGIGEGSAP